MLRVAVVTIFPEMLNAVTEFGITAQAIKKGVLEISTFNPRDYAKDVHRTVDDRPYGGGPGMVLMVAPVSEAISAARIEIPDTMVIYLSPQGSSLSQQDLNVTGNSKNLILLAGRYEGIDERIIKKEIDEEWSVGDYVLSGGELPAMIVIDAITRTIPGALGHDDSAKEDSFFNGILDYPHYTRPETIDGEAVPKVLISGDHGKIRRWRNKQALGRTWVRRPELLETICLDEGQQGLLDEFIREHKNDDLFR